MPPLMSLLWLLGGMLLQSPASPSTPAGVPAGGPAGTPAGTTTTVEGTAAIVNGERIPLAVVDALARDVTRAELGAPADLRVLRPYIVSQLIQERLLMQFLAKHGPKISAEEGEKILQANLALLNQQKKTLAQFCQESRQTEAQVKGRWLFEAQLTRFLEPQLTEAKLQETFAQERAFFARARIRPALILVRVPRTASPAEWQTERNKLFRLREQIQAGQLSFSDAAKKFSIDPKAPVGGEYGFLHRDDARWDDALLKAAFELPVGQLSEPIETESGFGLVIVHEKDAGQPVTLDQVREVVRARATLSLLESLLKKLEAEATIQITLPQS